MDMEIKIALCGNPNCGKTTMFNALTGSNQYVGNWPGVTVEKKEGRVKKQKNVIITDLPGIYSLSPYTPEEIVSRNHLIDDKPDVIINLVDATNIERNLYLTTQILELGIPVIVALNLIDISKKRGDIININKLSELLGVKVIETSALKETGLDELINEAINIVDNKIPSKITKIFNDDIESAISKIESIISKESKIDQRAIRFYSIKLLENDEHIFSKLNITEQQKNEIISITKNIENINDNTIDEIITDGRYDFIVNNIIKNVVKKKYEKISLSDRIDQIVTNRILGLPIFILIIGFVYYITVSSIGTVVTDWTNETLFAETIQPFFETLLTNLGAKDYLVDLVVNGIIGGLGSVVGFLPQMAIMFLFLSILEDIGYMARIAFMLDRIFRFFGLSGKSVIPLLISSGCGVPGILSTKTINNDNDRRLTIMTTTYVPCGAKLPVIALLAGVIAGENGGFVAPLIYFLGIFTVLISSIILKKFKAFHGPSAPFIIELPAYHIPSPKTVLIHVWERLSEYIKKIGTILFVACVVMWFLSSYGISDTGFGLVDAEYSFMANIGKMISFIFIPLGFGDWRAVSSMFSGFIAKESIVSTISILSAGKELAEDDPSLWSRIAQIFETNKTVFMSGFAFLVFNMLNSPCLAAISTLAKEMQSSKWTIAALLFQNVNAYLITLMIYQIGCFFMYNTFGISTIIAIFILLIYLFLILRPNPYKSKKI